MKRTPMARKTRLQANPEKTRAWQERSRKPLARTMKLRAVGEAKRRRLKAYAAHMRSPYWKKLRREVFERDGYRCRVCGVESGYFQSGKRDMRGLECDHLHYKTWGRESVNDCQTLCRECHRRKHAGQWWKRIPMKDLMSGAA